MVKGVCNQVGLWAYNQGGGWCGLGRLYNQDFTVPLKDTGMTLSSLTPNRSIPYINALFAGFRI